MYFRHQRHQEDSLEQHDAEVEITLTVVELILIDVDVLEEGRGDGVTDVASFELEHEEAQHDKREDIEVELPHDSLLFGICPVDDVVLSDRRRARRFEVGFLRICRRVSGLVSEAIARRDERTDFFVGEGNVPAKDRHYGSYFCHDRRRWARRKVTGKVRASA